MPKTIFFLVAACLAACSSLVEEPAAKKAAAPGEKPAGPPAASAPAPAVGIGAPPPTLVTGDAPKKEEGPSEPGVIRRRLLLLPPVNHTEVQGESLLRDALKEARTYLENHSDFILVAMEELDDANTFFSAFGDYQMSRVFASARTHGIAGVLTGHIEDISVRETGDEVGMFRARQYTSTARVRVRLYDVATQKEIYTRVGTGEVSEERTEFIDSRVPASLDAERGQRATLRAVVQALGGVPSHGRKVAWTGRIARQELHRYYVTGGELTGIRRGTLLRVFDSHEPVVDAKSGRMLGMAPGRFKGLLKVVDVFGSDASIAVVHSGGGFREDDRIEIDVPVLRN